MNHWSEKLRASAGGAVVRALAWTAAFALLPAPGAWASPEPIQSYEELRTTTGAEFAREMWRVLDRIAVDRGAELFVELARISFGVKGYRFVNVESYDSSAGRDDGALSALIEQMRAERSEAVTLKPDGLSRGGIVMIHPGRVWSWARESGELWEDVLGRVLVNEMVHVISNMPMERLRSDEFVRSNLDVALKDESFRSFPVFRAMVTEEILSHVLADTLFGYDRREPRRMTEADFREGGDYYRVTYERLRDFYAITVFARYFRRSCYDLRDLWGGFEGRDNEHRIQELLWEYVESGEIEMELVVFLQSMGLM